MSNNEIQILKRALEREKKARKQAESILEEKSLELYNVAEQLKDANENLQDLVTQKKSELKGLFENLNDAFVIIDLMGNVIKMNDAAFHVFGYENTKEEPLNLMKLVHPEDYEYTAKAFTTLIDKGSYTKYRSRIISKDKSVKIVEVNCSLIYNKKEVPIAAQGIARDITQEIASQDLIKEQRRQLNIIFDHSPLGISLSKGKNRGLLYANNSLCEMLGYTVDEFKKMLVQDITHPEDKGISKIHRERLESGEIDSFSLEKRYIKKDGDILWAKTTVSAVRDIEGNIKFQVATIEDVTNERLAKEQLIESENRLSSLILNLDSGVLLEDENGKIILTNRKFCDLFSIKANLELLKDKNCLTLVEQSKLSLEHPDEFITRIKELIRGKEVVLGDEIKMKDGRILERDYIPISQNEGYRGHLWTYKDVTLSRNYRKSLESQKRKYSDIIANLNLGLVELDNSGTVLSVNDSFMEKTQFSKKEILGKKADLFFRKGDIKDFIKRKLKNGDDISDTSYEFKFTNKNNEEKYWLVSGAPNYNLKGDVVGQIGIILDITNIKTLEVQREGLLKALEQRNEELEEYAHIVSHDLKSPLRSISALTSWLREDYESVLDKGGIKNIDLIHDTVEKMERLINDILSYSSINYDPSAVELIDTYQVIKSVKKLIFIPKHIDVVISKSLPKIKADKVRIQQLFQNLMSNAVNYIDKEEGIIEVSCKEKRKSYVFSVSDNGIGIAKEYHKKIFEVFESLGNHKNSTGIGLSIVKKIIDIYDGKIWLESTEGVGTTFFIEFKK